jgi:biotin operon repressor
MVDNELNISILSNNRNEKSDCYDDLILSVLKKTTNHSVSFDTILLLTGIPRVSLWKRLRTLRNYGTVRMVKVSKTSFWKLSGVNHE